uniref:Uncharacterized protein n=1 Tax=Desertifilum tharense IPPAS B-1220 TaxID=1781255 RepID=A0ACD5GUA5_9CYAN
MGGWGEEGNWELGVRGWGRRGWGDREMGGWGEKSAVALECVNCCSLLGA